MNVFQATLVLISFVAAKGSFPAVIFDEVSLLAQPKILSLSNGEVEVGFTFMPRFICFACPLDHNQREENATPEVLVQRKFETEKIAVYLNELPVCKLQPQATYKLIAEAEEYNRYIIGYTVYKKVIEADHWISRLYSSQDQHVMREVFTMNFNTATKKTISVEYELHYTRFISTASNKKHTFVYKKNEEFLEIDLDLLYQNFVDQILPRMVEEKSKNQLAHALGIQKVQLATPDDFPLDTWKMATYWNINTVPIWRVLLPRWNAIEIYLRNVFKRNIDIKIESGVSGTLELVESYYENNTVHKLHIPKYVWKVIISFFSDIAMVIVMHNDPFTQHQKPLCADICAINGWLVFNNDYRTGLVYCCKMNEEIAQALGYSKDTKNYAIFSFTKFENGAEDLKRIAYISSDLETKLYDW